MADVHFERSDLEISKEGVRSSTDIEELTEWLEEQEEVSEELAIMLGAMKFAPHADTERMARKLGFVNMSKVWIRKRLRELGVDDDMVIPRNGKKVNGLKKHIAVMEEAVQRYKGTIKGQNIQIAELRQRLKAYEREEARHAA